MKKRPLKDGSDGLFGLERESVLPCHMWCIQIRETYGVYARTILFKEGGERERGDGRDPNPKNMAVLIPTAKSRCWRQNLKVAAQRTHALLQDDEQLRCTRAHLKRRCGGRGE